MGHRSLRFPVKGLPFLCNGGIEESLSTVRGGLVEVNHGWLMSACNYIAVRTQR